jgi:hypothetical protein
MVRVISSIMMLKAENAVNTGRRRGRPAGAIADWHYWVAQGYCSWFTHTRRKLTLHLTTYPHLAVVPTRTPTREVIRHENPIYTDSAATPRSQDSDGRTMRVLIADDSEVFVERLVAMLTELGRIEIAGRAGSSAEAARAVRQRAFSAVPVRLSPRLTSCCVVTKPIRRYEGDRNTTLIRRWPAGRT